MLATGRREELGRTLEAALGKDNCLFVTADATRGAYLERLGCDYLQGYLYSRPVGLAEIIAFVRERNGPGEVVSG